jgi:hypothetical protein
VLHTACCGWPALCEHHTLGSAEITRYPKRYVCKLADGWREVRTMRDAMIASHEIDKSSMRV